MVAFSQKLRYQTDQNGPKGDHIKINSEYFQIQKWILQTVRSKKSDEENVPFLYLFIYLLYLLYLTLVYKIVENNSTNKCQQNQVKI